MGSRTEMEHETVCGLSVALEYSNWGCRYCHRLPVGLHHTTYRFSSTGSNPHAAGGNTQTGLGVAGMALLVRRYTECRLLETALG